MGKTARCHIRHFPHLAEVKPRTRCNAMQHKMETTGACPIRGRLHSGAAAPPARTANRTQINGGTIAAIPLIPFAKWVCSSHFSLPCSMHNLAQSRTIAHNSEAADCPSSPSMPWSPRASPPPRASEPTPTATKTPPIKSAAWKTNCVEIRGSTTFSLVKDG